MCERTHKLANLKRPFVVTVWNDGMCSECWDRLLLEAEEEAKAAREAEEESEKITAASASSKSYSTSSGGTPR